MRATERFTTRKAAVVALTAFVLLSLLLVLMINGYCAGPQTGARAASCADWFDATAGLQRALGG